MLVQNGSAFEFVKVDYEKPVSVSHSILDSFLSRNLNSIRSITGNQQLELLQAQNGDRCIEQWFSQGLGQRSKRTRFLESQLEVPSQAPIKEQVATALYRLKVQQNKLETAAMRMQQHDKEIFAKCVSSQMAHDVARASMYANECAEVRKMAKVTLQCQLALEQVSLRLETIEEFGDMARLMAPAASVVSLDKEPNLRSNT